MEICNNTKSWYHNKLTLTYTLKHVHTRAGHTVCLVSYTCQIWWVFKSTGQVSFIPRPLLWSRLSYLLDNLGLVLETLLELVLCQGETLLQHRNSLGGRGGCGGTKRSFSFHDVV